MCVDCRPYIYKFLYIVDINLRLKKDGIIIIIIIIIISDIYLLYPKKKVVSLFILWCKVHKSSL